MNKTLTVAALFALFSASTIASEPATNSQTTSVGSLKQTWQQPQAIEQLKTVENSLPNSLQGKTREQILTLKKQQVLKQTKPVRFTNNNAAATAQDNGVSSNNWFRSFNIYDGFSQLIEDYDEDGFYQTFSVTFDADVIDTYHIDQADVYAEMYLSKNGGDWVHYYTTDIFTIYGESENDQYEVYTTLNQGYSSDNYDVLIDLYEVGYSDIVASYSSDNTNALYALPLESSDYDPDYVEYHSESHGHGGSSTLFTLSFLVGLLLIRKPFA